MCSGRDPASRNWVCACPPPWDRTQSQSYFSSAPFGLLREISRLLTAWGDAHKADGLKEGRSSMSFTEKTESAHQIVFGASGTLTCLFSILMVLGNLWFYKSTEIPSGKELEQCTEAGHALDILLRPAISTMNYLIDYPSSSYAIALPSANIIYCLVCHSHGLLQNSSPAWALMSMDKFWICQVEISPT